MFSERLNVRQDVRVRADCFEGVCDVIEDVQVFDERANLVVPHVAPAGREREQVVRRHDRGIRVRQASHLRQNLIPRACGCLAERREETRRPVLLDSSANPDAFGSGTLIARRQSALIVPGANERGEDALDLRPLLFQGFPCLRNRRHLLTPRAPPADSAPQHADSA